MLTPEAERQMAANAEKGQASRQARADRELAENLATLQVGDWVATTWQADGQQRNGYVVGTYTLDDTSFVTIFEARPHTDRTMDGSRQPCDLCGMLPGGQWYATTFRCPISDIVEVRRVTDWHRQSAAKMIVRCLADRPGRNWKIVDTKRLLTALALVDGHEDPT